MKIVSVSVLLVDEPAVEPAFRWRDGLPGSDGPRVGAWLAIETDDGMTGWAYTKRGIILQDLIERRVRDELLGEDPARREWLWHRLWEIDRIEEMPIYIQGLVDEALWDLAGKRAGQPVHELLGTYRDAIPAYASTVTFGSIEEYLDVADQCLALGYRAIKLHAWGDARRDAELSLALRDHVGPEVDLMYDGSAGFDLADAVYLGRALSEAGYRWYEEPMREFSVNAHQRLAERVTVPLLVAETSDGAHMNTADFIASGCAGAVRTSTSFKGGITGAMRVAHLADAYLLRAEVHGGGLPNTHLCMAIPNTTYYEALVDSNPVERAPEVGPDGMVRAPTTPGMGYEAAWNNSAPPASVSAGVRRDR
ncbi:L-alanine-DL-glutamate epimerase-like enolase superfamily enzyme [Knoellia remsis]|uniref:L-alanine-DL-glutamate epimerase-like enolase superfamily enzyme n=1 Tax=Knoellia remsis TaxID=407159 RepID=A0A2T0U4L3_9MICO|nr:enolase C-terminal domain-like protein [Knoellia remsis]PRY52873.1 L-alanine-DL-glutamate epimerase-like enolase superfamily enzyme [Knoellia remsis]